MLILNYSVEQYLINGLVGYDQNIVYRSPTALLVSSTFMSYIYLDFPKLLIRVYHKFLSDKPCTWASIYMANFQWEKQCCSASTTLIVFFRLITIYKLQGVSIGLVKHWDNTVITLPAKHINTRLGL